MCNYKAGRIGDLNSHIMYVHDKVRPAKCEKCGKGFLNQYSLTRHTETVHEGIKNYKCDICDKAFGQKGDRNKHVRIVHEVPSQNASPRTMPKKKIAASELWQFVCLKCGNKMTKNETNNENKIECPACGDLVCNKKVKKEDMDKGGLE